MSKCISVCQLPDDGWFGLSSTLIERERERSSSDNQVIKAAACLPELSEDKREMASAQPHVVTAAVTASAMRNGPSPSSSETNVRKYEDRRLSNDRYLKPLEDQTTGEDDKVWNIVASKKKSKIYVRSSCPKPFT